MRFNLSPQEQAEIENKTNRAVAGLVSWVKRDKSVDYRTADMALGSEVVSVAVNQGLLVLTKNYQLIEPIQIQAVKSDVKVETSTEEKKEVDLKIDLLFNEFLKIFAGQVSLNQQIIAGQNSSDRAYQQHAQMLSECLGLTTKLNENWLFT